MSVSRQLTCSSIVALMGSAVSLPVWAQAEVADQSPAAAATTLEEIVVTATGTSIRGVAPVGSSLIEVDRDAIDRSAATTTVNLLRETPQIFSLGVNDTSRNGSGGSDNIVYGNAINIRGIGPYATLTLIDNRRAVPHGTIGVTVDPSSVPTIALQRVEVVADGASAVYGSDAIAGVANLILRRGYDGAEVQMQYGQADEYDENQLGVLAGKTWDSGQITVAAQRSFRSNLFGADRDFYRADLSGQGGADYRVTGCNPANITVAGESYAIPAGGPTGSNLVAGTTNFCDNLAASTDIIPEQEINSAVVTFDQSLTENVNLFANFLMYQREGERLHEPYQGSLTVPETNAFFVAPDGVTLDPCASDPSIGCESVAFSFIGENGNSAVTGIETESWQLTAGFDIDLPADWHLNTYLTYGENEDQAFSRGDLVNNGNLAAALASSDPNTAFNPFGTSTNNPTVLASIFDYAKDTRGETEMLDFGLKVDGGLFTIPGGEVKLAVGVNYYDTELLSGQVRGADGERIWDLSPLDRDVTSAFAEFFIPIVGEGNAMPGVQSLVLNIAGRIDDYSDVGRTENPKIGINWQPVSSLDIHASYGESFRAPSLSQLVSAGGINLYVQNYYDPTVDAVVRGVAMSGGNLDLEPETAKTYSLGFDYTPEALPGSHFSLNLFDITYEGQIDKQLANLNILSQEDAYSFLILRGADAQARVAELIAAGLSVRGGSLTEAETTPVFVDGRTNNLGVTETRGLDFSASIPFETDAGGFRVGVLGTWFDYYEVALTSTAEKVDQVNNLDYPLRLRLRGNLGWQRDGFDVTAFVNYMNGYNNTLNGDSIDAYTTVDLSAAYTIEGNDQAWLNDLRLGLYVNNLLDEDPPFVDVAPTNNGGGGFDPQIASPIGRMLSVSLSKKF